MKKIVLILTVATLLFSTVACTNTASKTSGEVLVIGVLPAESAIPIILAKENGYFEDAEIDVSIKSFSAPTDRNVAVQAGSVDAVIGDVMTAASFVDRGISLKITSDISEDFKILSSPNSGIISMSDLEDHTVSLVPNFILEYIMDEFAAEGNMDYEIVEIPSFSGRAEALMADQIDGVVFTEPQAGMLVDQGAHLLGSSKEAGIKGGTLLFTEAMVTERPEDIKAFYVAYNRAVDYMNDQDVATYSGLLSDYGFPEAIAGYLETMDEGFNHAGVITEDQFTSIVDWTLSKGQIKQSYGYDELTDFSFIN